MAQTYDKFVMIPHLEYQELLRKSKQVDECSSVKPEVTSTIAPNPPGVAEGGNSPTVTPQMNTSRIESSETVNDVSDQTDWKGQWNQL